MVALRISVSVSVSNDVAPNKSVCVKKESGDSNILQLMLFELLKRIRLLSLNIGQWRRKSEVHSIFNTRTTSTKWI